MKTLLALFLSLCAVLPAAAIELSLEENKAERGNIGYIDMHRLFQAFPETIRAKENFEELVRQAEEQLNLRKAEILRARSELSELKIEREFMAKTPIEVQKPGEKGKGAAAEAPKGAAAVAEAAEAAAREKRGGANPELAQLTQPQPPAPTQSAAPPAPPSAPSQPAPTPAPPAAQAPAATAPVPPPQVPAAGGGRRGAEPETDLTRPSIATLPGFGAVATTTAAAQQPQIPGFATPQQLGAPGAAPAPAPAPSSDENMREALEQSRRAAEAKRREPLVINIPGVSTAPIVVPPPVAAAPAPEPKPSVTPAVALPTPAPPIATPAAASTTTASNLNPALVELDAKIAVKEKELQAKELSYKEEQAASEKNLLDLESRKTEILLGKIHRAVQEVARREGVSVVVDKSSILYGHDAVDLTDKVMKYLRGS